MEEQNQNQVQTQAQTQNQNQNQSQGEPQFVVPEKYRPISAWGYFGYSLLFMLPIAGFIIMIVFACDSSNINRRNFARSQFCWLVIVAIVLVIIFAVGCSAYNTVRTGIWLY